MQNRHVELTLFSRMLHQPGFAARDHADLHLFRVASPRAAPSICRWTASAATDQPAFTAFSKKRTGSKSARFRTHAMRGQDLQPWRMHVDERHHHVLRRRVAGIFVAIGQRSLVAMMAVGDQQFLRRHQLLNPRDVRGASVIGHSAMHGAVIVDVRSIQACARMLLPRPAAGRPRVRIGIQHEDLSEVRARVTQQFQTILFRPAQRLLVPEHDARRIILDFADPDKAFSRESLARIGHLEFLRIRVKSGRGILGENAFANPVR